MPPHHTAKPSYMGNCKENLIVNESIFFGAPLSPLEALSYLRGKLVTETPLSSAQTCSPYSGPSFCLLPIYILPLQELARFPSLNVTG